MCCASRHQQKNIFGLAEKWFSQLRLLTVTVSHMDTSVRIFSTNATQQESIHFRATRYWNRSVWFRWGVCMHGACSKCARLWAAVFAHWPSLTSLTGSSRLTYDRVIHLHQALRSLTPLSDDVYRSSGWKGCVKMSYVAQVSCFLYINQM